MGCLTTSAQAALAPVTAEHSANSRIAFNFIAPSLSVTSSACGPDIAGRDLVLISIAEMRPYIVHDRGDLVVSHRLAEGRHATPSVDDELDRIAARLEVLVGGQCGIGPGAGRP